MSRPRYVPIRGRNVVYDRLNQSVKHIAPEWMRAPIRLILELPRRLHARLRLRRQLSKVAPLMSPAAFDRLRQEARIGWKRETAQRGSPRVTLPLPSGNGNVVLRRATSDILVYDSVMVQAQYGIDLSPPVHWIIDAGANVGIAAAYFLDRYHTANCICLEPDPVNAAICRANLQQFGERAVLLEAALAPAQGTVTVQPNGRGTWASQVRSDPAGTVPAVDIESLLARFSISTLDILKIDIEGGELPLFLHPNRDWLGNVRAILVEHHSSESETAFYQALSAENFSFSQIGEIVAAIRRPGLAAAQR